MITIMIIIIIIITIAENNNECINVNKLNNWNKLKDEENQSFKDDEVSRGIDLATDRFDHLNRTLRSDRHAEYIEVICIAKWKLVILVFILLELLIIVWPLRSAEL